MERVSSIAGRVQIGKMPKSRDESRAEREQFAGELLHVAAAYRHELTDETIRVYWQALKGIPVEIRTLGLTQCLKGTRFFPTVAEVLNACADVVDVRRKVLADQGEALKAACQYRIDGLCTGRWRDSHNAKGIACVVPCDCHQASVALLEKADKPIARPALPAAPDDPEVA